ncbi:MAG: hypothetical protein FWF84_01350 [Kiritimatiellaeota bacterium]|nr:hypothetical protein [Kiritimatiellota bacterium]
MEAAIRHGLAMERLESLQGAVAKAEADRKKESWTAAQRLAEETDADDVAALSEGEKEAWAAAVGTIERTLQEIQAEMERRERIDALVTQLDTLAADIQDVGTIAPFELTAGFEDDAKERDVRAAIRRVVEAATGRATKTVDGVFAARANLPPAQRAKAADDTLRMLSEVTRLAGETDALATAKANVAAITNTAVVHVTNGSGHEVSLTLGGEFITLNDGHSTSRRIENGMGKPVTAEAKKGGYRTWRQTVTPTAEDAQNHHLTVPEFEPFTMNDVRPFQSENLWGARPRRPAVTQDRQPGEAIAEKAWNAWWDEIRPELIPSGTMPGAAAIEAIFKDGKVLYKVVDPCVKASSVLSNALQQGYAPNGHDVALMEMFIKVNASNIALIPDETSRKGDTGIYLRPMERSLVQLCLAVGKEFEKAMDDGYHATRDDIAAMERYARRVRECDSGSVAPMEKVLERMKRDAATGTSR